MELGDIAVGVIGLLLIFIGYLFLDIVLEFFVLAPGYLICRLLYSKRVDPDNGRVVFVSIVFWGAVIAAGLYIFPYFQKQCAIDSCLDSGGRYDYQHEVCIQ
ncbi:MAG: hypothetical protein Q3M24_17185 [Candidatus Electrothrix aestuarii]|uniref:Uncharacterized protein n=1 Tax=Candidatus Electrothrix aestuarii TaxID=3062594 RepID=A0AAU8LT67_9BACT|nr:hypothetical protein [Candidatus Electrothrix aestuarii]